MTSRFPFTFNNAFFTEISFSREPDVREVSELDAQVQVKVVTENLPNRLQVHVRLESDNNQPVSFLIEVVGLFDLINEADEPDLEEVYKYINEQAFFMLWPYLTQMSRILTTQMGMNPVNWNIPQSFLIEPSVEDEAAK